MTEETEVTPNISRGARYYRLHRDVRIAKNLERYHNDPDVQAKRAERERLRAEKEKQKEEEKAQKEADKERKRQERLNDALRTRRTRKETPESEQKETTDFADDASLPR